MRGTAKFTSIKRQLHYCFWQVVEQQSILGYLWLKSSEGSNASNNTKKKMNSSKLTKLMQIGRCLNMYFQAKKFKWTLSISIIVKECNTKGKKKRTGQIFWMGRKMFLSRKDTKNSLRDTSTLAFKEKEIKKTCSLSQTKLNCLIFSLYFTCENWFLLLLKLTISCPVTEPWLGEPQAVACFRSRRPKKIWRLWDDRQFATRIYLATCCWSGKEMPVDPWRLPIWPREMADGGKWFVKCSPNITDPLPSSTLERISTSSSLSESLSAI